MMGIRVFHHFVRSGLVLSELRCWIGYHFAFLAIIFGFLGGGGGGRVCWWVILTKIPKNVEVVPRGGGDGGCLMPEGNAGCLMRIFSNELLSFSQIDRAVCIAQ